MENHELYNALYKAIGSVPIKMQDLAQAIGLAKKNEPVGSSAAARCRVQLKKLRIDGKVARLGARATAKYVRGVDDIADTTKATKATKAPTKPAKVKAAKAETKKTKRAAAPLKGQGKKPGKAKK